MDNVTYQHDPILYFRNGGNYSVSITQATNNFVFTRQIQGNYEQAFCFNEFKAKFTPYLNEQRVTRFFNNIETVPKILQSKTISSVKIEVVAETQKYMVVKRVSNSKEYLCKKDNVFREYQPIN